MKRNYLLFVSLLSISSVILLYLGNQVDYTIIYGSMRSLKDRKIKNLRDSIPACCKALTKECLSCATGLLVHEFCENHKGKYGCPANESVAPDANICCQMETPLCKACQQGISVEEYLQSKFPPISPTEKKQLDRWYKKMQSIGVPIPKLNQHDSILDIGANVGVFSETARKICPKCHIYAFEAVPLFASYIKTKNFGNIDVYPFGLSDENGKATFWMAKDGNFGWNTMIGKNRKGMKKVKTEFKIFDDLNIDIPKLQLIKIDTEGAEYKVLRGLNNVIRKQKPTLLVEFGFGKSHPNYDDEIAEFDKLIAMGYTCDRNYRNVRGTKDLRFTVRVSTKPILLGKHDNEKYDTTANIMTALDRLSIDSFLLAGSALGAHRNNGWFHWDKDIDILVMSTSTKLNKMLDDLGLHWWKASFGYQVRINNTKTYIDLWLYEEQKGKLQCVGHVGEIQDCFRYCRDVPHDRRTCNPMPKRWAYPPRQVPFGPYTMPTMRKEYLNDKYGSNWMTHCGRKPCKSYHKTQNFVFGDEKVQTKDLKIMIGIPVHNRMGYVRFSSRVLTQYNHVDPKDIFVFDDASTEFDENKLREWYGKDINYFRSSKRLKADANTRRLFTYFSKSNYDILLTLDSDLILDEKWKQFVHDHIDKSGVLSLYHSAIEHHKTLNCNGNLCEKKSMGNAGTVMKRGVVQKMLQENKNRVSNFDWGWVDHFKSHGIKMYVPKKSLVFHFGKRGQNNGCGTKELARGFDKNALPSWIKLRLFFYFDKCKESNILYPTRKFLLFTSAGDKNNVKQWISDDRLYDIHVVYYGTKEFNLQVDEVYKRKETKFPNLQWYSKEHDLSKYKAVAVWDDDIVASPKDINALFKEMIQNKVDVFSPCHTRGFKNCLKKANPSGIRDIEYIEMNAPMFNPAFLVPFIKQFDPIIKGWGTDIWFSHLCSTDKNCRISVSDTTCVTNPITRKDGTREINKAQPEHIRSSTWSAFAKKHGLPTNDPPSTKIKGYDSSNLNGFTDEFVGGGMSKNEKTLLANVYSKANSVGEWGMGSSTLIAKHIGVKTLHAIDSSSKWVHKMKSLINGYDLKWINIGNVKEWGYPTNKTWMKHWYTYSQYMIRGLDVYLVDGRFRVACAAQALLNKNAPVLVHDFQRKEYKVLLDIADIVTQAGKLVVLKRKYNITDHEVYDVWEKYKDVPV